MSEEKLYYTDEKIGQEFAWDIIDAEVKACIHLGEGSGDLYALTAENDGKGECCL